MDNGKKNTPQVFTSSDIRKHARNWTLAGDVGLLAHLERFSENIINKTQETQKNFGELVNDYEELYTKVGNVTNQFLALQNCQFVENRVYDEETPTEEKTEVKVPDEAEQEKLLLMQYKKAVEVGVKLLDTHFQEIQLPPNSDSDEEDEVSPGISVIWKPKNLYAGKKFPLLIGSAEWWADDYVGLRAKEDILDSDKVTSESESDIESLKSIEKQSKSSSSSSTENMNSIPTKTSFMESSEDLFGFDKNKSIKAVPDDLSKCSNSLVEEPSNFLPNFDKEPDTDGSKRINSFSEDQSNEPMEKQNVEGITSNPEKVDNEFTRELMAKLVSVTNKTKEKKSENKIGEGPLTPTNAKCHENLFDETDDNSDLFSSKTHGVKDKSAAENLFFDNENDDDLFKGKSALFSGGSLFESHVFEEDVEKDLDERKSLGSAAESKTNERKEIVAAKKNVVNDLFDDLDDDDTLFAVKPVNRETTNQSLPPKEDGVFKVAKSIDPPGMFWDNDEGLFDSINSEIDHTFLDSSDLFGSKVSKMTESKISADLGNKERISDLLPKEDQKVEDLERKEVRVSDSHIIKKAATEKSFDDLFGFSSSVEPGNKKIRNLDSEKEKDLFSKTLKEEKKPPVKIITLAEDEDDEEALLFGDKPKPPDSVSVSSSRSSLFDDVNASKSRLASVFEKDKSNKSEDDLFTGADVSLFAGDAKPEKEFFSTKGKEKEKNSLFGDWDDGDDLFGAGEKKDTGEKSSSEKSSGDSSENIKQENFDKKQARSVKSFTDTSGDDDLFKASPATTMPRETKSDILRHSSQKLFADDLDDTELFSDNTETMKPKPPSSLSLRVTDIESKGKTVGKLNIPDNLKIRLEYAATHVSQKAVKPFEEEKISKEKKEEFSDESVQVSTLLKCPSKDRVKIPVRRRPQSRRARQEAIRNSGAWDLSISSSSTTDEIPTRKDSLPSSVKSNPLSPSTDEEDFFKVPELDKNFEKEDQSIFKSDLFESSKTSKLDDSLLFDGAPVLSPLSPKKTEEPAKKEKAEEPQQTNSLFESAQQKTKSLFDDFDDLDEVDESLFKTPKIAIGDLVLHQTPPAKTEGKLKKALFDLDGDDDDDKNDLFGGTSRVIPKLPAQDKPKKGDEPRGKGSSSFVDPLGLMK